jgi:cytochrome c-type biogenesis protein CcmH/NrfF
VSRYPGWLLPVLALVVLGFVVWRVFVRRFKSVEEIVQEGRELQAVRLRSMAKTKAAGVLALNVRCPLCGAEVGSFCADGETCHLSRYDEAEAAERRRLDAH